MRNYRFKSDFISNPAKIADDAVLALSTHQKGNGSTRETICKAMELCEYILSILSDQLENKSQTDSLLREGDKKALLDSEIDKDDTIKKLKSVADILNEIINEGEYNSEDIINVQRFLLAITMPLWRNRTSEFRERKLRRGLVINA